ncbi:MAG: transporter [Epulopiscium sp. Nuni2H_MBin001]|nr:MAG: transporter [Epulopiscium sp. Nuni2H_MBin001]
MIDVIVICVYFVFLVGIGWIFRTFSTSTSDYFKGGGKMLWWMVGATAFMTQFSAWSFTGAAGKAFTDGFAVLAIFFGNAVGYFCNYLFFAAKARQMRVTTPIEGIRLRFGKVNEQAFTLASVPISIISAGIWLNGLAVFVSAVFGISMTTTIMITGTIVVLMSVSGGSWAVIASDFLQMVIIMAVSVVAAIVAIVHAGGVGNIFELGLPEVNAFAGNNYNYMNLFLLWVICAFFKQFMSTNNMIDSYRYLCAKDTKNARKAALLACTLMFIGPIVWFLPAWFVAAYYPDTATWGLDNLSSITDATYYVFVRNELPAGMVGLMMSAMFAATMSSMDSALNRNSGIYVKNVHKVFIDKEASDETLLKVGRVTTLIFGIIIILVGQYINNLKGLSLFEIMQQVSSLLALPMLIPALFGYFVKKTPDWAGWGTLLVGIAVSYFISSVVTADMIQDFLRLEAPLTSAEFSDMKSMTLGVVLHGCITLPFFLLSQLFYKEPSPERKAEIDLFFTNVETEVIADEDECQDSDTRQRDTLGKLLAIAGIFIILMVLLPNESGRLVFIAVGAIVTSVGAGLIYSAKNSAPSK